MHIFGLILYTQHNEAKQSRKENSYYGLYDAQTKISAINQFNN